MAAQHEAALEAEQKVLSDRVDRFEPQAVEPLGDALRRGLRMRRLDLEALADERLQRPCGTTEGVALGHVLEGNRGQVQGRTLRMSSGGRNIAALARLAEAG